MDSRKPLVLGLALALSAFTVGQLGAQQAPQQPAECHFTLQPAEVAAGSPAREVQISMGSSASIDPATIRSVATDDASGLQVALVDGKDLVLAVDAAGAKAGTWEIRAYDRPETKGAAQPPLCVGTLTVK